MYNAVILDIVQGAQKGNNEKEGRNKATQQTEHSKQRIAHNTFWR